MAARSLAGEALGIGLRFVPILAVVGVVWWQIMPPYAWLLGRLLQAFVQFNPDAAITSVAVEVKGIFKTGTELILHGAPETKPRAIRIAMLVTNIAPFVALVLATPGLSWSRRGRAIIIGGICLVLAHLIFLLTAFYVARDEWATALGQICITLPFPLWIALAYWDRIMMFLGRQAHELPQPDRSP